MSDIAERREKLLKALASAAEAFQKSGDRALEAQERFKLGLQLLALGRKESFEQFSRAAELYSELNDISAEAKALFQAGHVLVSQGQYEECLPYLDKVIDLSKRCGDDFMRVGVEDGRLGILVKLQRWNEALDHCARIVEFIESKNTPEFREYELKAHYHWAHGLMVNQKYEEALPHAQCAADLAADLGEHDAEALMRTLLAHILKMMKSHRDELEEEYERMLALTSKLDNRKLAAQIWFQHARYLECTTSPTRFLRCSKEYQSAAKLFDECNAKREAGDSYYGAATSLNYLSLVEPQYREESFTLYMLAIDRFKDIENWSGKGVAEFGATGVLLKDSPSDPEDPRKLPLLYHSVDSFSRAGLHVEEATSRLFVSVQLGSLAKTDEYIQSALHALRSYERARPSLLLPHVREREHKQIARILEILTVQAVGAATTKQSDSKWKRLVWQLEQAVKGRSYQDQRLNNEAWNLLLKYPPLREATQKIESLEPELEDLSERINSFNNELIKCTDNELRKYLLETIQLLTNEWKVKQQTLDEAKDEQRLRLDEAPKHVPYAMELASVSPATVAEIQSILNPGEAYLGFMWYGRYIVRVLLQPEGDCSITVFEEIDGLRQWLREGKQLGAFDYTEFKSSTEVSNVNKSKILLGEIPDKIDTLIISPNGPLVGIPWHQLPLHSNENDKGKILSD